MPRKLYKRDNTGAIRVWWAVIEGSRYRLHSGQMNGKIVVSEWTSCVGKNIGRSNETRPEEQCFSEVQSLYEKKLKRGYTEKLENVDKVDIIKPMLAHRWEEHKHKIKWPVSSQPKLDGIRCIANSQGLWSRKNEPILTVPHIAETIIPLCKKYGIVFDGELYNHDLRDDFNSITSLVRRQKSDEKHAAKVRDVVQYHLYDLVDQKMRFIDRWGDLCDIHFSIKNKSIKLVPTAHHINQDSLDLHYSKWLEMGYEGQMVRADIPYQHKRTDALLKRKEFTDEEFEIVDMVEGRGNRSGMVGAVVLRLDKKRCFNAALMGTDAYRRRIWEEHQERSFEGVDATVKYFHKTPDGVPRFPVVKFIDEFK